MQTYCLGCQKNTSNIGSETALNKILFLGDILF